MLDMPVRTGWRLQGAARRMQEGIARRTEERQQVNSLHRQRMTCSDSLRSFTNTQDWTGGMGVSPSGRFQVVEQAGPKRRIFSREGLRWDAAWFAISAVILICAVILLADIAGMGLGARSISRLESKIEDMSARNEAMRQELAISAGDVSVCTEAVKLNLISGYGARTIVLTAPQELSTSAVTTELRVTAGGWMTGDADPCNYGNFSRNCPMWFPERAT